MCQNFFDIRAFGAVMTTAASDKSLSNVAGQVRGPVQLAFGKSVEPIVPRDITITRMAAAPEKEDSSNMTMGRKSIVPYGLYRQEGYISANLARTVTGFSDKDLEIFWESVEHMFDDNRSAARGQMALRELIVFKHENPLGNAPAHKLFSRVSVTRKEGVATPRAYSDYSLAIDDANLPSGVTVERKYRDDV
ncbi:MAG: type I-C CRISPR-associated protein Cas7/Csd2 [Oscillospiraceae bacterium]|nr:type I-C CRISPR-associated protein Cas7/Csd2 [Oscillospiraceae bacterium]